MSANKKENKNNYGCQYCRTAASFKGQTDRMPKNCPTLTHSDLTTNIAPYLAKSLNVKMMAADQTPFTDNKALRNRAEEIIFYAKQLNYKKIGIAFCVTLINEAQSFGKMLQDEDLISVLVCCRVGAIDYSEIGLPKAHPDKFAAICNPVAQANLLNLAEVDMIVQVGLCLGHDMILQDTALAPVTTLVVKDRVFDHNPVKALRKEENL